MSDLQSPAPNEVTDFRLTLELAEETRARWQAAAERNGYERLDVWAYDTLDAAADPDAGQVLDFRARLTTAETEVERLLGDLDNQRLYVAEHQGYAQIVGQKLAQSEARVEALSEALRRVAEFDTDDWNLQRVRREAERLAAVARAALACPPQQPQKAGEPPAEVSSFTMLSESELLEAEAALQRPTPDREENEPPVKVAREPGPTPQESLRLTPEGEHTSPAACPPPESSQG